MLGDLDDLVGLVTQAMLGNSLSKHHPGSVNIAARAAWILNTLVWGLKNPSLCLHLVMVVGIGDLES